MRITFTLLFILSIFSLSSCQKDPEIILIGDNQVQPDETVPEVVKQNYVTKLYIGLLGRKPSSAELQQAMGGLDQSNAAVDARKQLLETVMAQPEFSVRMYEVAKTEILNNIDSTDIVFQIFVYNELLKDPNYQQFRAILEAEIDKLEVLLAIPNNLIAGTLDRRGMHAQMVNNFFYDEINMGSQNFVLSLFEYFLDRYPTEDEEAKSIGMVDGFGAVLFGKEGSSKGDFISLFFSSDDYLEGQVTDIYSDFLLRRPTSVEMSEGVKTYRSSGNYRELLKAILSTDEYLGG